MNVFIIIFILLVFSICILCILNYIRAKKFEHILKDIQDKEEQQNIVYKKMLDEYVKMLSAMDLNAHCYNSINEEYIAMNNTFEKLIERIDKVDKQYDSLSEKIDKLSSKEQMQVEIDTKAILDTMDATKWINKGELQK